MGQMVTGLGYSRSPLPVAPPEGHRLHLPAPYKRRDETSIEFRESPQGIYEVDEKKQRVVQFPTPYQRPGQIIDIWV